MELRADSKPTVADAAATRRLEFAPQHPVIGELLMKTYFVAGKRQQTDHNTLAQHQLLDNAGYPSSDYYLISTNGHEYRQPEEQVPIADGEKFEVKPLRHRPVDSQIQYEVNGERQTAQQSPITLKVILDNAGRDAGIDPAEIHSYRLENVTTGDRYSSLDELVPVSNDDSFVAIYTGATPVA